MLNRYTKWTFAREALILLVAVILLLPFYLLVNVSLKSDSEAISTPAILPPTQPTFSAFVDAASGNGSRNIPLGMINSTIITAGALILLILIGSIAAYTLSRRPGKLSNGLYIVFLIGIILPFQLGIIPAYVVMRSVGLLGTHIGMILLYTGLLMPLAVFLYTGFARELPKEYEEAAQIDGASRFQTFRRIVFPLLSPATGTVAILCGLIIWNDFFTALIFLNGSPTATLPVVVYSFVGEQVSRWNVVFAAVLVSIIPILTFYLLAQKKFIQGFAGGIKS
jgi:raffinose/stachyose/melibiose transport system permease protein